MSDAVATQLIFEHPLNERMRTFLRLEHLFDRVEHFLPQSEPWGTRAAMEGLLDAISITARADIRNEVLKEIERNLTTLNRLRDQRGVDPAALSGVTGELERAAAGIHGLNGPIGAIARDDEFLKVVAQRHAIPGGACSFDLPAYHYFLALPPARRGERVLGWFNELRPVADAIRLVLSLARTSARARPLVAIDGFFQEALDVQTPAQLVRVGIDAGLALFPEVSGHKNRFSIRFLAPNGGGRPQPSRAEVPFTLTCCVF